MPIFKLHGSLNWLECRGGSDNRRCEARSPALWQDRLPVGLDPLPDLDQWRRTFEHGGRKWTPVMVPFVHHKDHWTKSDNEFWKGLFDGVWDRTQDMLASAQELHFWGYSLPEADHAMSTMLWRALRRRPCGSVQVVEKATGQKDGSCKHGPPSKELDRKTALMVLLESLDLNPQIHLCREGLAGFLEDQIKDRGGIPADR